MFSPVDAYAASFRPDGAVVREIHDPTLVPTVVVSFVVAQDGGCGDFFDAVYHENQDIWEVFDSYRAVTVARRGHGLYDLADQTVDAFRTKLLDGPCPKSMEKRLTQQIASEIDFEIIRDLQNCLPNPPKFAIPSAPRKLKATWSTDDCEIQRGSEVVLQSTIYKP